MKKILLKLFIVLMCICAVHFTVACDDEPDAPVPVSIYVDLSTVPSDVNVDELYLSDIKIKIKYSDGSEKEMAVSKSMLSQSDIDKLATPGTHNITITYLDMTTTVAISLKEEIVMYKVIFVDYDGKELKTITVNSGSSATPPNVPTREGYTFIGWDMKIDNITSNITVTAQYEINSYNVKFLDYDGSVLKDVKVNYGSSAQAPSAPTREGYTFIGWDKSFNKVTSNLEIRALYQINKYQVQFVDYDKTLLWETTVEHGLSASYGLSDIPTREGYTFIGWDKSLDNITENTVIIATYEKIIPVYHKVVFYGPDNQPISEQIVEHGKAAVEPDASLYPGYKLKGWFLSFSQVIQEMHIHGNFEKVSMSYIVQFYNAEGQVINIQGIEEGFSASAPANAPTKEGYTLVGWDKDFTNVTSDLDVYPIFEINKYEVKFIDYDGRVLYETTVEHGLSAAAPDAPTREGHTFVGWDKEFSNITSALEVNAIYEINKYEVKFVGSDGTVLYETIVEHGSNASYGSTEIPVPEGYVFTGWDKEYTNVTSDLIITAQYQISMFEVVFRDYDENIIYATKVEYGLSAIAPDAPTLEGYTFVGWDKDFSSIKRALEIYAVYEINKYEVRFVDYDGTVLYETTVEHGSSASYDLPSIPTREGYTFTGWDKPLENIVDNTVITALYELNTVKYIVQFFNANNQAINIQEIEHGLSASAPTNIPTKEGYTFTGWDKDFSNVTSDLNIYPLFEINKYEVKFVNYDGSILYETIVEYGLSAQAPTAPKREGYEFIGWDKEYNNVTTDLVITAQYQIRRYEVTFIDYEGSIITSEMVDHGGSIVSTITPIRDGYKFIGWDKELTNITSSLQVYALYEKLEETPLQTFTVKFIDYDGTILSEQSVLEGSSAVSPEYPTREGYIFINWDKEFVYVYSNLEVYPIYEKIEDNTSQTYTVKFVDYDGTILSEQIISEGSSATAPASPSREGYTFIGWDKEFTNITTNLVIKATYEMITVEKFTVTFNDENGNLLKSEVVEYGQSATAPGVIPQKTGYKFLSWSCDFTNIISDLVIVPTYQRLWIVTFIIEDGQVISTQYLDSGENAKAPAAPSKEGYTFVGWSCDFTNVQSDLEVKAIYQKNNLETNNVLVNVALNEDGTYNLTVLLTGNNISLAGYDAVLNYDSSAFNIIGSCSGHTKYNTNTAGIIKFTYGSSTNITNQTVMLSVTLEATELYDSSQIYDFSIIIENASIITENYDIVDATVNITNYSLNKEGNE